MKCFADQLIRHKWAVEITGVDMIDAACHRLSQHADCSVAIPWGSEHARTGKLHCAVTHPVHFTASKCKTSGFLDINHHLSFGIGRRARELMSS